MSKNPVYYRIYFNKPLQEIVVVCMQDFDENDYNQHYFLTPEMFETEDAAELTMHRMREMFRKEAWNQGGQR